jgi:intracellular sulfur oxidation DsrE/DsrF family protein
MMIARTMTVALAISATGAAQIAPAAASPIPSFGKIAPLPDAAMQPDPHVKYRVAFSITRSDARRDEVNPGLEKVARYINLLAAGGVRPRKGDVLAVVHGPATELVLNDDAFRRKYGTSNPNIALIDALRKAGVEVHVCGQALAAQKIARADVYSGATVDVSALVTLTTLQLRGWSVMAD